MNKLLTALALTAIGIGTLSVASVARVFAHDNTAGHQTLIARIAERFNLNESEVQTVFDEFHDEHHQDMQQRMEERLTKLVEQGSLTSQRKDALLAKHAELESQRESLRDMDHDERHEAMQSFHEEMKTWAEEQGIDLSTIMPLKGRMHHDMMKLESEE